MTNREIQTAPVWPIIGVNVLAAMCVVGMLIAWRIGGHNETGVEAALIDAAICLSGGGVAVIDFRRGWTLLSGMWAVVVLSILFAYVDDIVGDVGVYLILALMVGCGAVLLAKAEPHLRRRKLPVHRRVLDAVGWLVMGLVGYFLLYARQTHIMILELYAGEALIIVLCLILAPGRRSRT